MHNHQDTHQDKILEFCKEPKIYKKIKKAYIIVKEKNRNVKQQIAKSNKSVSLFLCSLGQLKK